MALPKYKPAVQPEPEVHAVSTAFSSQKTNVEPHFSDQTSQQPGPEPEPTVRPKNDQVVPEQEAACASTPLIMNTTLDLLDNSDTYFLPIDPEVQMNDVRNILCLVIYFFGTVIFFIKILKYNLTTTVLYLITGCGQPL